MAKTKKASRTKFQSAQVSLKRADLGWHGAKGGRTVTVIYYDGRDRKVGELRLSAARVRWWGARDRKAVVVSASDLDDLFIGWSNS
jgi:hypothetical protein